MLLPRFLLVAFLVWLPAHPAGAEASKISDPELRKIVTRLDRAIVRCDKENLKKVFEELKDANKALEGLANSGIFPGAKEDAKLVGRYIAAEKTYLACDDTYKTTGLLGTTYGFAEQKDRDEAAKFFDAAAEAVKKCDRQSFGLVRVQAGAFRGNLPIIVRRQFELIDTELGVAATELFAKCLDTCIVGTWQSQQVVSVGQKALGGDGIVLRIEKDAATTVDYKDMKPMPASPWSVASTVWRGSITGHLKTSGGKISVVRIDEGVFTAHITNSLGTETKHPSSYDFGPVLPRSTASDYACEKDKMTIKSVGYEFTFKRAP